MRKSGWKRTQSTTLQEKTEQGEARRSDTKHRVDHSGPNKNQRDYRSQTNTQLTTPRKRGGTVSRVEPVILATFETNPTCVHWFGSLFDQSAAVAWFQVSSGQDYQLDPMSGRKQTVHTVTLPVRRASAKREENTRCCTSLQATKPDRLRRDIKAHAHCKPAKKNPTKNEVKTGTYRAQGLAGACLLAYGHAHDFSHKQDGQGRASSNPRYAAAVWSLSFTLACHLLFWHCAL